MSIVFKKLKIRFNSNLSSIVKPKKLKKTVKFSIKTIKIPTQLSNYVNFCFNSVNPKLLELRIDV